MNADAFYARVQELGQLDSRAEARAWTMATLRAFSHVLPDAEARRHFAAQLPSTLKAALQAEPPRGLLMDRDTFVQHVAAALDAHASEGARAVAVACQVLTEALAAGQIAEVRARLPADLAQLFPEQAAA